MSKVVIPNSYAVLTHLIAASDSTCEPWVIQLPYEISEIYIPVLPRRRYSMIDSLVLDLNDALTLKCARRVAKSHLLWFGYSTTS